MGSENTTAWGFKNRQTLSYSSEGGSPCRLLLRTLSELCPNRVISLRVCFLTGILGILDYDPIK